MSQNKFDEIFSEENFTLKLTGKFGIPEIAEMLDFLKSKKQPTIKTQFQVGDMVQVSGYATTEYGEVLEVDIYIKDDGEPIITYTVDNVGERWESGLEPYNPRLRRDY